jgi:hypothetical protein
VFDGRKSSKKFSSKVELSISANESFLEEKANGCQLPCACVFAKRHLYVCLRHQWLKRVWQKGVDGVRGLLMLE